YTIAWTNGANTATVNGVCDGNYIVTVTDAAGCTDSDLISVTTVVNNITIQLNASGASCPGTCNGQIVAFVSGSGGPYSFDWSNGANSSTLNNLCPGTYTLTVTSQAGCVASESATISTSLNNTNVQPTTTAESSSGDRDGPVTATGRGGSGPCSHSWSNGANTAAVSNLCAGTYNLTVTDPNGCTFNTSGTVSPGAPGQPV